DGPREGHRRRRAAGGEEISRPGESHVHRPSACNRRWAMTGDSSNVLGGSRNVLGAFVAVLIATSNVLAQTPAERPAVGPERPFQLAPRIDRTLANGLRVIVARRAGAP